MKTFDSSLLREKFIIHDAKTGQKPGQSITALSNRFVVDLRKPGKNQNETFIVRGHNMHSVIRMTGRIIHEYDTIGPIGSRQTPYDWEKAWNSIVNDYEYAYVPERWIAIYQDGKCIYQHGDHHPFLDMIEKCDHENDDEYDYAVPLAEQMFQKAGKRVKIDHNSNVALSVHFENNAGRCGVILRGSNRTTTFTFTIKPKDKKQELNIPQCLGAAAAFLEGVQLAFLVGMNTEKIHLSLIDRFSKEEKQTKDGRQRLIRLASEISNLENAFDVRYRPEKPEFSTLLVEAEELAKRILTPEEDEDEDDTLIG